MLTVLIDRNHLIFSITSFMMPEMLALFNLLNQTSQIEND